MTTTHYDVLDARPDAPVEELRRCFHSVSRKHHPDLAAQRGETAALVEADEAIPQRINEAWRVLSDPALRRLYDAQLAGEAEKREERSEKREREKR
jgi:DnaJ-class molecular chaperone